eukprot:1331389-Pyramimonas_sp.AAC.1
MRRLIPLPLPQKEEEGGGSFPSLSLGKEGAELPSLPFPQDGVGGSSFPSLFPSGRKGGRCLPFPFSHGGGGSFPTLSLRK